jgi:hypothetical protein
MSKPNKVNCDICQIKSTFISDKSKMELEREGFEVYCSDCATKLNITPAKGLEIGVKVYKMN